MIPAPLIRAARHPGALRAASRPETQLALWRRAAPWRAQREAARLAARAPFCRVAAGAPEAAVARLGLPPALRRDALALARAYAAVTGETAVRLRVEAIADDACRRFHVDAVPLRLLCTWHGAGTEWLPLGGGAPTARALDPMRPPVAIRRVPTGAVALLRGSGGGQPGLIHRSPPMGARPSPRLLLCVDAAGAIAA
jgi:hypothetical protein